MNDIALNWDVFLRAVVPFASANIFAMVLVYFFIVRGRFGRTFALYATFLICFILFLLGPTLNLTPLGESKRWFDIFRNIVLFSIGTPSLLLALLIQSRVKITRTIAFPSVLLGISWSVLFVLATPLYHYQSHEIPWLFQLHNISDRTVHSAQVLLVSLQLLLPSLWLIKRNAVPQVNTYLYGVVAFCLAIGIGSNLNHWGLYYGGCSLTAIIWAWAVYQDIQLLNDKVKLHSEHQNNLAIAQYSAPKNVGFANYYPVKFNESYPFREREALLQAVQTGSAGIIHSRVTELADTLEKFTSGDLATYQIRAKEILFMMVDAVIFNSGSAAERIERLEQKRISISEAQTIHAISEILLVEAAHLTESFRSEPNAGAEKVLVDRIKSYILTHYHEDVSIRDVVEEMSASRSHLMKIFKNVTSQTINQYLVEVRINKAKDILLSKSVTDTAFEVGFNNSTYFSTVFKKHTGHTPKEYQLQAKTSGNSLH
ncbi:helix-turn-helix transcriptional regulator [Echinimonas agarilytica]|uniref:AraC family transcriptional regulator n=1 Tax=Echinimonas agarilytica TaxID=1215918 RepID=A0AA42B6P3_9GAMM|nr:AraC family transcriptional regulator [Echinimonas agarilytica]MCM2678969.1 AraC family transcriptional regulator [Echinimonas agarilytica]